MLEAYAKKLIVDGELKPVLANVEEPLPYLFGKKENFEADKLKFAATKQKLLESMRA